jgi:hypothetical protein
MSRKTTSKKVIKYALKHKKSNKLVGYSICSNSGDFCCDEQYILCSSEEKIWYVDTPEHAEWVRNNSTKWYNAGYDTPTHYFKADELEVVKVEITTTMEKVDITFPTYEEIARFKSKGDKHSYKFYMYQKEANPDIGFDLYDLKEWMREKKGK